MNIVCKRKLASYLAAFLAVGILAGCTQTAPAPEQPTPPAASQAEQPSVPTVAPEIPASPVPHGDSPEITRQYLDTYFGIKLGSGTVAYDDFLAALNKITDEPLSASAGAQLDFALAVKLSVMGGGFEELALTYPAEKTAASLQKHGVTAQLDAAVAPYIACALDTGLIAVDYIKLINDGAQSVDDLQANQLLMAAVDALGKGRNFIGYTDDPDIYGKLINARESFVMFENDKLSSIGAQAVMNKVTTGYNLLCDNYNANFLPDLTLRYGHSTTRHASQLLGLLASEGIVAKVQLEPKTSIFEYLPEWGDIPPATPEYKVEKINDNLMLAFSNEYDLVLEFANQQDKLAFDKLIMDYAKKNDGNEDGKGLLFASWWQPLYVSSVEMKEGYNQIYDNVITDGIYSLHPFCLPEQLDTVKAGFKAIDPAIEVVQIPLWCDEPFYRYLNGEYQ